MAQRRYFLLDERVPKSEIDSFICRVVETFSLPQTRFAPSPSRTPGQPSHNTNDIIPDILPEPVLTTNRKDLIQVARKKGIRAQLSILLHIDVTRGSIEKRQLESNIVKQYALPNPEHCFKVLMQNEHYAQDVQELLERTKTHRAYLVTGFLTAVGTTWTIESTSSTENGFGVNVPVSIFLSVPAGDVLNFTLQPQICSETLNSRELFSEEEEIFAVSYSVVDLKRHGCLLPGFGIKTPVLGLQKRAKAYHLALGDSDDSSEEFEFDSDNEFVDTHTKLSDEVILNVDHNIEIGGQIYFEVESILNPE
ncbi:hypothetical protein BDV38DRAFT_174169 [Aspergillus pseudotamarii]|uniref:Uncharacterized protein n=1 Tax=Aspergillus pseudotamarii TaxID=132259 RepID=A0A5N6T642_ASPPS|nr:uncharacterized protein BDV38DRAFT_174169 [Aspergillus pseudotamarii]KAE8141786.1 hypothetical protein BDV38DRAFT_174169 [Aspergillus pseudotamarii]